LTNALDRTTLESQYKIQRKEGYIIFARLVSAQVKSDKLNEVIAIWKDKDIPELKSVKGYLGVYLLTDRKTGKAISITLWDSEEDAIAYGQSELRQKQVDMYKDLMIGEPVHQLYEVSAQD
jgi:heme-degrading monooxygenase HmoA